uniref:Carboxypeptidase n=1 Tax=Helianthus annuus TaxID=4232 RepID=A0A251VF46_HELAN
MESTPLKPLIFLLLTLLFHHLPPSSATTLPTEALPTKSGYLTVNSTTKSAIFYTFYEAQNPTNTSLSETPLVIWLQGGPGCSSMTGNFYELGPFRVTPSLTHNVEQLVLEPNPGSWNRIFGLLFLDNPIGTGFSIASTPEEIPTDQQTVAKHLFIAIRKFIALDPVFKTRPVYITGESYAGKYVPAIGYYILKRNPGLPVSERVNLFGLGIGNGLTDPAVQVSTHALHNYNLGLINEKQKIYMEKLQIEAVELVKSGNWSEATDARNKVLRFLQNVTGLATLYDFRRQGPYGSDWVEEFLKDVEVKRALGVNESMVFEGCSDVVGAALHADVMKSVRYMVEYVVKNTKVVLYQGQCDLRDGSVRYMVEYVVKNTKVLLYQGQGDLRDGVVSVESWVRKMKWEGLQRFLEAERSVWKVNDVLAGYVQKSENLTHVVVLGAGHFVPTGQAVNSQAMIEDWVLDRGLFANKRVQSSSPGH